MIFQGHVTVFPGVTFFFLGNILISFLKKWSDFQNYQFFLFFGRVYRLPLKLLSLLRNSFQGENTNISRNPIRWFWVPSIPAFIERLWFFRSERKDPGGPSVSIELNYYQQNQHKTHIFFEPGRKHGDEEQNRFELHKLPGERKRWFDLMSSFMDVSVFLVVQENNYLL